MQGHNESGPNDGEKAKGKGKKAKPIAVQHVSQQASN